jgi:hypothetical protein
LGGGKKSVAAKPDCYRRGWNGAQSRLDSAKQRFGLLSDKFQGDVQRFMPYPTGIGGEGLHAFHEARDSAPDTIVNVECDEEAHGEGAFGP